MLLEIREASRKTPKDGRFEVSEATARRLAVLGDRFTIALDDSTDVATLERMACSCDKATHAGGHTHHFLIAQLLKTAMPERTYVIELNDDGVVRLTRAHDGISSVA